MNTVMNIRVPYSAENFLTSFSRKSGLHAVSSLVSTDDNTFTSPNLHVISVNVYKVRHMNINIYARIYCRKQEKRDMQILIYPRKEMCTDAYKPTGWGRFQHKFTIHIFITN